MKSRCFKGLVLQVIVISALFWGCGDSSSDAGTKPPKYFIEPGHEATIAQIFIVPEGKESPFLPFKLEGIEILSDHILVRFSDDGTYEAQLTHPNSKDEARQLPFSVSVTGNGPNPSKLKHLIEEHLETTTITGLWAVPKEKPHRGGSDRYSHVPDTPFEISSPLIVVWLGLLALLVVFIAKHPVNLWFCIVFAVALLIRLSFGTIGPGTFNILYHQYGQAPQALLSLFGVFGPLSHHVVIWVARILGSLAAMVFAMAVFELKKDWKIAFVAGVLLALQPMLIRYSSDCERQSYVLFLSAVSLFSVVRYYNQKSLFALISFVLSTILALESRPEAILIAPIAGLLVWPGHAWKKQTNVVAGVAIGLVIVTLLRFPSEVTPTSGSVFTSFRQLFFDCYFTGPLVAFFAVGGFVVGCIRRDRTVLWGLLAFLLVQAATKGAIVDEGDLYTARFRTLAFLPFIYLASVGLSSMALPFRNKIAKVVVLYLALVIVLIDSTPAIKRVMEPRTNDLEFQYLVKTLPLLPDKSQVYYPEPDVDSGFYGYEVTKHLANRPDITWLSWKEGLQKAGEGPAFFYLAPMCNGTPEPPELADLPPEYLTNERYWNSHRSVVIQCLEARKQFNKPTIHQKVLPAKPVYFDRYAGANTTVGFAPR